MLNKNTQEIICKNECYLYRDYLGREIIVYKPCPTIANTSRLSVIPNRTGVKTIYTMIAEEANSISQKYADENPLCAWLLTCIIANEMQTMVPEINAIVLGNARTVPSIVLKEVVKEMYPNYNLSFAINNCEKFPEQDVIADYQSLHICDFKYLDLQESLYDLAILNTANEQKDVYSLLNSVLKLLTPKGILITLTDDIYLQCLLEAEFGEVATIYIDRNILLLIAKGKTHEHRRENIGQLKQKRIDITHKKIMEQIK